MDDRIIIWKAYNIEIICLYEYKFRGDQLGARELHVEIVMVKSGPRLIYKIKIYSLRIQKCLVNIYKNVSTIIMKRV